MSFFHEDDDDDNALIIDTASLMLDDKAMAPRRHKYLIVQASGRTWVLGHASACTQFYGLRGIHIR